MALPADCSVALLPIKPIYADAIVDGRKHVEFRKTPFRRRVTKYLELRMAVGV